MDRTVTDLFRAKKNKAAFRRITHWLAIGGKPSEVSLAKALSSVITHILIDMEGASDKEESKNIANEYRLMDWMELQTKLITAEVSVEATLQEIEEMLR